MFFATVDADGNPQVRNISAIHYEPDTIYFFTARGKDFCKELLDTEKVQVLGYTMYKEMIRLTGTVKSAHADEQEKWKDVIFTEQPYLANVYPGMSPGGNRKRKTQRDPSGTLPALRQLF